MKTAVLTDLESRAANALSALVEQVSAVTVQEMKHQTTPQGGIPAILARVQVFGHSHSLACAIQADESRLRASLEDLKYAAPGFDPHATPVLIAPRLSPEAQKICKEHRTGYIDFEGNARLSFGDYFVSMRAIPGAAFSPAPLRHKKSIAHRSTASAHRKPPLAAYAQVRSEVAVPA